MEREPEFDYQFTLGLSAEGLHILKSCVDHRLELWPGGDPTEQQHLFALQGVLNVMMLESMLDLDITN